ncbi:MAG: hypothetical protein IJG45_04815 [Oscillospiraceae bacterium]|nr:hypothetical protein [Oscillospiraceae bacterium]
MKSERIYDSLTNLDDAMIREADTAPKRRKRYLPWLGAIAAVLAVAVLAGVLLRPGGFVIEAHALTLPEYPAAAPYPDLMDYIGENGEISDADRETYYEKMNEWYSDDAERQQYRNEYSLQDLSGFLSKTLPQFLGGTDSENRVYSPLNVYMALALLAETADSTGRQQILDLMGVSDMDTLRTRVHAIWNANYCDDGVRKSVLANSLWLNDQVNFRQETLDLLAQNYYASSYAGAMGTKQMDDLLHNWMNEQTDDLLKDQIDALELDDDTVAALVSTVLFTAKWDEEFSESVTTDGVFHAANGDEPCRMMHQESEGNYYWADHFAAVAQNLEGGGSMWFFLPDEGVTPEDLLHDPQLTAFLLTNGNGNGIWENQKYLIIQKQIAKFDVASQIDAKKPLQELGVTDVFDWTKADFSPLTQEAQEYNVYVSDAIHGARVMIDEKGCKGAAYMIILEGAGAAEPPDERVDFILDRPFIFAITGTDGLPLFIGIVNHPNV